MPLVGTAENVFGNSKDKLVKQLAQSYPERILSVILPQGRYKLHTPKITSVFVIVWRRNQHNKKLHGCRLSQKRRALLGGRATRRGTIGPKHQLSSIHALFCRSHRRNLSCKSTNAFSLATSIGVTETNKLRTLRQKGENPILQFTTCARMCPIYRKTALTVG